MPAFKPARLVVICALLVVMSSLISACSSASPEDSTRSPNPSHPPELWGDMKPIVSVKELMRDMIDPLADYVFDAVSTVVTQNGVVEKSPKTDADWDRVRMGGVSLAEGA